MRLITFCPSGSSDARIGVRHGKNIPGFGPLGPEIVTMDEIRDPYDLWMTCSVNGEQRMRVNTSDQTALFLKPGDVVECSIEGIATLRTYIV